MTTVAPTYSATFNPTLSIGNYTWFVQCYNGDGIDYNSTRRNFYYNSAPVISNVIFNLPQYYAQNDLEINFTVTDLNNDSMNVTVIWYVDDVEININSSIKQMIILTDTEVCKSEGKESK
jgi:hypothetical protein